MKGRLKGQCLFALAGLMLVLMLAACGGGSESAGTPSVPDRMKDGTYTARSEDYEADENGNGSGYGQVELTIGNNAITGCSFAMYELDGTLKDETYGADLNQENRLRAQKAVQAGSRYAAQLAETGSPAGIDAISGATICYKEFMEAVGKALDQAAEK